MFGFTNLNVHHIDGDDVAGVFFCQVGTHTDEVPMLNPATSVLDKKYYATTSVVADNRIKMGMMFADILCVNQSPKSVGRVNPGIPSQKKHVPQKEQVAWFTLARWKLYLDICVAYHTAFVTWLLNNLEDSDTTLVGNFNDGVTSSSLKGYSGRFHIWVNDNGMAKLLSITCTKEEGCHSEYASDREWVVTTPQGVLIPLKMYTGLTKGMPYIDIR